MLTYLKIHLLCILISLTLRGLMVSFLIHNPINKLFLCHYRRIRDIMSQHELMFTPNLKMIFSRRINLSLKLPDLPCHSFISSFFCKKVFLQAIVLGPLQILIEGFALSVSITSYLSVPREDITNLENHLRIQEREKNLQSHINEESDALELFTQILLDDMMTFGPQGKRSVSNYENLFIYIDTHLNAESSNKEDAA